MEIDHEILKAVRSAMPRAKVTLTPSSVAREDGVTYAQVEIDGEERLLVSGREGSARGLEITEEVGVSGGAAYLCPLTHDNASELRRRLSFTAPSVLGKADVTIGTGDRLGLAGRGHIRAIRGYRASPVLAQQSVRELTLTARSFPEVLDSSTWAVFAEGFRSPWGADGDHLKAEDKVKEALSTGYTMITADVSDHLHSAFLAASEAEAGAAYAALDAGYRKDLEERYLSRPFALDSGGTVAFSPSTFQKTVLAYRDALEHALTLFKAGVSVKRSGGFDFELSIDETDSPTSPQAHVFMALEARRKGIAVTSIAPRFVGEFQKGIDYIGSVKDFESGFETHAAIARSLGHRISVHSGSDKFSVFPAVGRLSRGRFHLKTAGTSWLEALRVIAAADAPLFRDLYARALDRYSAARALYHVTPDMTRLPKVEALDAKSAPALLEDTDARRVLHITYGEMLSVPELKKRFFTVLGARAESYRSALQKHIGRHLETLGISKRE